VGVGACVGARRLNHGNDSGWFNEFGGDRREGLKTLL